MSPSITISNGNKKLHGSKCNNINMKYSIHRENHAKREQNIHTPIECRENSNLKLKMLH